MSAPFSINQATMISDDMAAKWTGYLLWLSATCIMALISGSENTLRRSSGKGMELEILKQYMEAICGSVLPW
jgi:hypothetical protein